MQLTAEQLKAIYPNATNIRINAALPHLNNTLQRYGITTIRRVACFLGQVGVESGELLYTREIWGPTPAQKRYEGRADLGNTQAGDGFKFRGRGLIQTTGRANYAAVSRRLAYDFVADPEALERYPWAALSAGDYWDMRKLNALADYLDVEEITRRVNGGSTHLDRRIAYTNRALQVLGETAQVEKKKIPALVFVLGAAAGVVASLYLFNRAAQSL